MSTVCFVGAGPGAADLLTLRAARILGEVDIVIWARSLVDRGDPRARAAGRADPVRRQDVRRRARRSTSARPPSSLDVARVHSGDPTLYGTLHEQLGACRALGLDTVIVPGVSSLSAAAAALGQELTIPDVSQSLIITRRAQRTSMPPNEQLQAMAAHGTTMALFLSVRRPRELQQDLIDGGYAPDTPDRRRLQGELAGRDRLPLPRWTSSATRSARRRSRRRRSCSSAPRSATARAPASRTSTTRGYGHRYRRLGAPDRYKKPCLRSTVLGVVSA